jgi:hypothetical protein
MPLMNGSRLITELQAEAASSGRVMPPTILMTAANPRLGDGVVPDVLLPKPFDLVQVEALLERFLGRPE